MTASPDWATWSLQTSDAVHSLQARRLNGERDHAVGGLHNGGVSLFKSTGLDDVCNTEWQDYDEGKEQHVKMKVDTSVPQGLDVVDVDELFREEGGSKKESDIVTNGSELFDIGYFHFDPLSPVESRALQRALKLSKYIPPTALEVEEDKQRILGLKVATNGRRVGSKMNEETGKRVYNAATRGTGVLLRENNEAKEVFRTMCKSMLPRRHFEWIMAQLTYHKCNMIGFDSVPSSRTLLQEEAKEAVYKGTMPMHDLAHVTRLLAEASKVDTSSFDIADPTKGARVKGRPAIVVKNRMLAQSKAIFDALQQIFPGLFQHQQQTSEPPESNESKPVTCPSSVS